MHTIGQNRFDVLGQKHSVQPYRQDWPGACGISGENVDSYDRVALVGLLNFVVRIRKGIGQVTVAKAYRLLRIIIGTTVEDGRIIANP